MPTAGVLPAAVLFFPPIEKANQKKLVDLINETFKEFILTGYK
jgi:hypothetical protein